MREPIQPPRNLIRGFNGGLLMGLVWLLLLAGGAAGESPKREPADLKKILADFEKYAEEARQAWKVPGMAIAIVQGDKVIFAKGFGVKQWGKMEPVDEQTIFQIGSTSKAFTAALMAMLVDEKHLGWQDKVVEHFADFQMYDPWVTREFMVEDLMAQRSGLPSHAGDLQPILGFDRNHVIRCLRYIKPGSSFRSRFAYQNGLFLVAGALIQKYTGQSWEDNIQKRIFEPLEMSASSTSFQALHQAKNRATGHEMRKDGTVEMLSWDWPYHEAPYIHGPAGGINSNIMDMSKWLRLQLAKGKFQGKRLMSEENLEFLQTPKTIVGPRWGEWHYYGEAWGYTPKHPYPLIWHTGGTQGNKTMVALVPQGGIGMVVLSNLVTDMPQALAFYFYDRYFHNPPRDWSQELLKAANQAKAKGKLPPRPSTPAPPLPLERYVGSYSHPAYGNLAITVEKDFLVATLGSKKCKGVLRPWDRDTFLFYFPDIAKGEEQELASFKTGADGQPQSLFLEWDGGTEFKRIAEKTSSEPD